ncbi:serine/threonine-protein kinase [Hymenobacter sp. RP-2-7]|uniref:Serine/threonine-protein kinase n=1 Tax=Hymenobacter polaris TaxID=2682546 RepID=A0A7Y0FMD5_9BACT|nr:leucine-rich repeat-containing protein kinase family protein [Hymenobacter polaris]NML65712.1 serine/threonine-protein kinase [Hymenobacter polaris]
MHTLAQLRAGHLAGTTRLDLSAGLTEFPPEIFDLADSLEILNLSGNALRSLPADLPRLHRLQVIFCSDNQFTELPAVLGECPNLTMIGFKANQLRTVPPAALPPRLRWLILTDNELSELPAEIGNCPDLQKLMLAGNRLRQLPPSLARCQRLELLRLAANRFEALPAWLLAQPRLAWLAYAGNPLGAAAEAAAVARHPVAPIAWGSLTLEQRLGEGASGVIYRAAWHRGAAVPTEVAVKLFKGAVTSDGLPHSEMLACRCAGPHPHLVPVRGQVVGHPTGAEALVLDLIDPAFTILAGPPSLASCTRDVYAPSTALAPAAALGLALGVAQAAAHLHAQNILHGDLYAHNILYTPGGEALLSDFGAAAFFDPAAPESLALQQLETRALGCLLEELLTHCPAAPASLRQPWQALINSCLQPAVASRPLAAAVSQRLAELARLAAN